MSSFFVVRTSCTKSFARSNTTSHSILRLAPISGQRLFSGTPATFGRKKAPPAAQSVSPLAPIGVNAALQAASDSSITPKPKIFDEFALTDRVGIVSGANRGLGLEMALAFCEAGARAIYCFDLPPTPSDEWTKTQDYVKRMQNGSRLEYVSVDVRDQKVLWHKAHEIGDREKRMDVCVAAAGILKSHTDCLTYPAEQFEMVCFVGLFLF
jgi:short chain dehydrogenase